MLYRCHSSAQKLRYEPVTKHDPGRQPYEKDADRKQCKHTRGGEEQEICAHHTRNRPAGADGGDIRLLIQQYVQHVSGKAADEIEEKIFEVAEVVFDVVPEDPQGEHV